RDTARRECRRRRSRSAVGDCDLTTVYATPVRRAFRPPAAALEPHAHALVGQEALGLADAVRALVEDARGEYRVGAAGNEAVVQVIERTDAAGRDHGHRHRLRDRLQQLDVVAGLGAVAVHA